MFINDVANRDEPQGTEDAGQRHPTLVRDPQLLSQTEMGEHKHNPLAPSDLGAAIAFEAELRAARISGRNQRNARMIVASLAKRTRRTVPSWCFETEQTQMTCSMIVWENGIGDGYVVCRVIAFILELGYDGKKFGLEE